MVVDLIYGLLSMTGFFSLATLGRNLAGFFISDFFNPPSNHFMYLGLLAFGTAGMSIAALWFIYAVASYVLAFGGLLEKLLTPQVCRAVLTFSVSAIGVMLFLNDATPHVGFCVAAVAVGNAWTKDAKTLKRA
jgi:hypothetical protein